MPMRLFVAAWPDEPTRRVLHALAIETITGLRVVRPEQWHVTLRFLGNVDPELVPAMSAALRQAAAAEPPVVATVGPVTGWFGRGAVLQVPVGGLGPLAARVRAATVDLVPVPEPGEPPFDGHLTLARGTRRPRLAASTCRALAGRGATGEFRVDEIDLVVSQPGTGGHRYVSLARFPLEGTGREPRPVHESPP
jgi:RNA 2',3'-cyclic 3'-phosphodiesterase